MAKYDVVVVGAGNAAFCAAQAAAEKRAKVIMVERAPDGAMGGNCRYTAAPSVSSTTTWTSSRRSCRT